MAEQNTRQALIEELAKWTKRQVDAHNKRSKLMPPISNLTKGDQLIPWKPTRETLAEYDKLTQEEENASAKCREIIAKLTGHN
jgi:hypothetical protein